MSAKNFIGVMNEECQNHGYELPRYSIDAVSCPTTHVLGFQGTARWKNIAAVGRRVPPYPSKAAAKEAAALALVIELSKSEATRELFPGIEENIPDNLPDDPPPAPEPVHQSPAHAMPTTPKGPSSSPVAELMQFCNKCQIIPEFDFEAGVQGFRATLRLQEEMFLGPWCSSKKGAKALVAEIGLKGLQNTIRQELDDETHTGPATFNPILCLEQACAARGWEAKMVMKSSAFGHQCTYSVNGVSAPWSRVSQTKHLAQEHAAQAALTAHNIPLEMNPDAVTAMPDIETLSISDPGSNTPTAALSPAPSPTASPGTTPDGPRNYVNMLYEMTSKKAWHVEPYPQTKTGGFVCFFKVAGQQMPTSRCFTRKKDAKLEAAKLAFNVLIAQKCAQAEGEEDGEAMEENSAETREREEDPSLAAAGGAVKKLKNEASYRQEFDLLKLSPKNTFTNVLSNITPTAEQLQYTKEIVDYFVQSLKDGLKCDVVYGGDLASNTTLPCYYNITLVPLLLKPDTTAEDMKAKLAVAGVQFYEFAKGLGDQNEDIWWNGVEGGLTHLGLQILHIRVVPGVDLNGDQVYDHCSAPLPHLTAATVASTRELYGAYLDQLAQKSGAAANIRDLIRLTKYWACWLVSPHQEALARALEHLVVQKYTEELQTQSVEDVFQAVVLQIESGWESLSIKDTIVGSHDWMLEASAAWSDLRLFAKQVKTRAEFEGEFTPRCVYSLYVPDKIELSPAKPLISLQASITAFDEPYPFMIPTVLGKLTTSSTDGMLLDDTTTMEDVDRWVRRLTHALSCSLATYLSAENGRNHNAASDPDVLKERQVLYLNRLNAAVDELLPVVVKARARFSHSILVELMGVDVQCLGTQGAKWHVKIPIE